MKIYKFRPLENQTDFDRAKVILETGHFWCSQFMELNDPMEGVFRTTKDNSEISDIFTGKCEYKICSFSGRTAFKNPAMWGYYANGFMGLAFEINVKRGEVEKINYDNDIQSIMKSSDTDKIRMILLAKFSPWRHENEYRFLKKSDTNYCMIGEIRAVYYGDPYREFINREDLLRDNQALSAYVTSVNKLRNAMRHKKEMKWYSVDINGRTIRTMECSGDWQV